MAVTEHPLHALKHYLPEGSFEKVVEFLHLYKVHLTVSKVRKSVLGDYRHAHLGSNHRISVNGNLNQYEFLITLLHELAHLLTYEAYKNKVEAHGKEWKCCYGSLLNDFIQLNIFPSDVVNELKKSMQSPAATANGEIALLTILRKYNQHHKEGYQLLSSIPEGALFITDNGKIFKKGKLRRKRYACVELKTGLPYTVSAISEVKQLVVINH
jgi:SprT protein